MTMPRVLSLDGNGQLCIGPPEELHRLRLDERNHVDMVLADGVETVLDDVAGDRLELVVEIDPGDAGEISLVVRRSPDAVEQTVITYLPAGSA